jgi:PAS domain S-box-containing protein
MAEQMPYLPTLAALRKMLGAIPAPRLVVDEHECILLANATACDLLGYAAEDLTGKSIDILTPEGQVRRADDLRREWEDSPEPRHLGRDLELRVRRSDGTEVPVEVQVVPWLTDDGVLTVIELHDLTSAQYDNRLFRTLLDSAPDAVIIVDGGGTIRLVNTATEESFGYGRGELVGQSVEVLVPDHVRGVHHRLRERYASAPERRPMGRAGMLTARRKDGSEFPAEISLSPVKTEAGGLVIAEVRDLTDRLAALEAVSKAEEEQRVTEEVERLKSLLLATISHELRTPLSSILGFCELISEIDSLDPKVAHFVSIVLRNARREVRLVDDLLTLVDMDQGGLTVQPTESDLTTLVLEAVTSAQPDALASGLELSCVAMADPIPIRCDPERIGQAVDALLSNAVKFTPSGGTVLVEVEADSENATIRVTDSGIGIDIPDPSRVFERLYRSPLAVEQEMQGAGMGLSIAWSIAAAHQGSLELAKTGPEGSTFALHLPLRGRPEATLPTDEDRAGRGWAGL